MGDTTTVNGGKIPQWAAKYAFGVIGSVSLALGVYAVSGVSDLDGKYKALSVSHASAIETEKITMSAIVETAKINNDFMKERFLEVKSDLKGIQVRLDSLSGRTGHIREDLR